MNMLGMLALQQAANGRSALIGPMITVVSFGLIMYFLIIRPQRKIQSTHQEMLAALKKGDEVMTEGGVIGTVVHIAEDRVTLKSADTRLVVAKLKISRVFTATSTAGTESQA